ncbi:MAG TPA: SprT family zinc-dependent metalloprotease [Steroidobacteraceae bacterium]|nr:SprT family zinc-dependent metalloprotease [Steroidobacteraceae bacterium]
MRESRRARRLAVRVFHTGRVEVVVPSRTSPSAVERFVSRHRGWIERKCQEARSRAAPGAPFPPERIDLAASQESWRVQLVGGGRNVTLTRAEEGLLALAGDSSNGRAVHAALRRWLLQRAAEVLEPMLARLSRTLGYEYRRLLIRRQRTRWGSCSSRGTISLNCCLLFQRAAVVEYLMIHELAHTRHMNHSRRFWQAVAKDCPAHRALDRELLAGWRRVPAWVFADEHGRES